MGSRSPSESWCLVPGRPSSALTDTNRPSRTNVNLVMRNAVMWTRKVGGGVSAMSRSNHDRRGGRCRADWGTLIGARNRSASGFFGTGRESRHSNLIFRVFLDVRWGYAPAARAADRAVPYELIRFLAVVYASGVLPFRPHPIAVSKRPGEPAPVLSPLDLEQASLRVREDPDPVPAPLAGAVAPAASFRACHRSIPPIRWTARSARRKLRTRRAS